VKRRTKYKLIIFASLLLSNVTVAQFYNGHQMTFGKNRVQYNNFYWQYYRFEKFDIYFNEFGQELALYTEWFANQEIQRVESLLDYSLDRRIIFLVYNKLTDFRQGNIGLVTGNEEYNTGGVTRIVNNKVFLYYDGDHKKFQQSITAAIAEVMLTEMLYGNELRENMANSTLINLPDWFIKGLLSYLSENWSVEMEDKVKDGILSGKYKKINRLTGDDAVYAGHSFWKYIEETYGRSVIPNIIYITRINKSAKNGFLYVVGSSLKEISVEWLAYYKDKYSAYDGDITDAGDKILKRPKKKRIYEHIRVSPDGNYFAFVTNESGQYRLWLYNEQTGRRKCLVKREHRIEQIPDYSFPVVAWHPSGKILTFLTEEKGGLKLYHYNLETKDLNVKNFLYMEKVLDFSYSNDGSRLVMSAVQKGQTDIFVHTLASGTNEQITNDLADDLSPRFVENSKKIIFSSNRTSDSLKSDVTKIKAPSPFFQLYLCNYPPRGDKLSRITTDSLANHSQPLEFSRNQFAYLSDQNGIINRYLAEYDSTISLVDTSIHYRFYTKSYPLTNYKRNVLENDIDKKGSKLGQIFLQKNRNYLFKKEFSNTPVQTPLINTAFRKELLQGYKQKMKDSIRKANLTKTQEIKKNLQSIFDSTLLNSAEIDINHYVFEIEKQNLHERLKSTNFSLVADTTPEGNRLMPKIRIYQTAFYTNFLVSQVDFTFLNSTYQAFNGGTGYYNPGFNLFFKIGTNDLFEDYKIIGGFRFSVDFESNEYLLSFENLKKRLDKQIIFHRQAYKDFTNDYFYIKTITHDGYYILKYPLSQVFAVRGTASLRYDRVVTLSTDVEALNKYDVYNFWGGLKLELIFDNTRPLDINIYSGSRFKVFGEAYKQLNRGKSDLFVVGADFRHYQVIHRNLIFASRFAGSSSFGGSRLIYYLGSVDNWILSKFDNSIRIDNQQKYAYQTLATNMRGFYQNIRNGNNFAVINNEIRWPFVKYFANYPISSNFWSSLQAIGFFDIGSAWTGWSPYSGKNAYDYDVVTNKYTTVTIDSNRSPIVYGYGFGVRAQLLGYFMRFDWAWGVENKVILPKIFYFSLSLDF
jgi:Tol biopolymer transport system component